ncbi:anti-sigma factor [Patescibacteria group bacterium]
MKKTIPLLIVSIFVLSACLPTTDGISDEMVVKHDLTEEEVKMLEEMDITDETIDAWMDEIKAMGPGLFDFNAELEDVSGGTATGNAGAYFEEGYNLFAEFNGLPHPEEGYFYEGWVVRNSPLSVISTGKAERSLGDYFNDFQSDDNLLDHDFYVLTLEPDDGDPAPAEHILEGTMK